MDYLKIVGKTDIMSGEEIEKIERDGNLCEVENNLGVFKDGNSPIMLEKKTLNAFYALRDEVKKKFGLDIFVRSGFRNEQSQKAALEEMTKEYKSRKKAEEYVASPGASEHHTGLAFDFNFIIPEEVKKKAKAQKTIPFKVAHIATSLLNKVVQSAVVESEIDKFKKESYAKVNSVCSNFGLITTFKEGAKKETGYPDEPWHLRYVDDVELAQKITASGKTLKSFLADNKTEKQNEI